MPYNVIVDNISMEEWEQYAREFSDYSIYQTWPYQQVRAEMSGQELSRAVIKDENGRIVSICHVRIKRIRLLGLRIGYVQWGPLVRTKDGSLLCTAQSLRALCKAYFGTRVNILRVVPNIFENETGREVNQMLEAGGFERVGSLAPYRTLILRVDDSEEGIRKRLRKSFRRDLKKAEKSKIEVREGTDREFCEKLEQLYLGLLKRKNFKGLNPREFVKTQGLLSYPEKMNIIVAYLDGEPIAAHLASNLGDTGVVLLAASNEKGLTCGASYLMWYKGAIAAWRAGMRFYDLGGIDPDNNPYVYQFKSRQGGEEHFHIGVFDACISSRVRFIWRICDRIYRYIKG
jgi:lipid II:glycine glycyltransferase (peptidoglycan interpeptide bridge formation enzyme)